MIMDENENVTAEELFQDVTGTPKGEPVSSDLIQAPAAVVETPAPAVVEKPEPAIPPSRLREESERARAAERRADQLAGEIEAMRRGATPAKTEEQPVKKDVWVDPEGVIRETVQGEVGAVRGEIGTLQQTLLAMTKENAISAYKDEKIVTAAEDAFMAAIKDRSLHPADYDRVVNSPNRYKAAVEWHRRQEVLTRVGSDPLAYEQSVLDKALENPEFLAKVLEKVKGQASPAAGRQPITPLPSLSRVGAVAMPEGQSEVSDEDVFTNVTSAKKRRA